MQSLPLPFSKLCGPLEPATIARFEEETRRVIPGPYKAFLRRSNGAEMALPVFRYRAGSQGRVLEGSIDTLLGIDKENRFLDLRYFIETYVERNRIPEDLYPIGVNDGDDLILMGGEGSRFGQIFYWFHELESPLGQPPTERNVYLVADSLDEFLASLKPFLTTVK